jgi:hypothetical protein
VRDVDLQLPRGGVDGPVLSATVRCWTGRGTPGEECTVEADYGVIPPGPDGTPPPDYDQHAGPTAPGGEHTLVLGDLTPGAYYRFRLVATQTGGAQEATTTGDYRFTQTPGPVPPEPVVSGVTVTAISATGATVSWTTAEPEPAGQVDYGPTPALGSVASEAGAHLRTAHTVTLSGLTAATEYTYRIFQPGWRGNSALTAPATFTTAE